MGYEKDKREQGKLFANKFLKFLKKATVPYTVVKTLEQELSEAGFKKLEMDAIWKVSSKGRYYVKPFDSIVIAFTVGKEMHTLDRFKIVGSHIDSPGFKIKPNPDMKKNNYHRLNIERYGGPINQSWMDRKLSLAGKVMLKSEDPFKPGKRILDIPEHTLFIPSLAIHRNRKVNEGVELSVQKELIPILGQLNEEGDFKGYLAEKLEVKVEDIVDFDMNVYIAEDGILAGKDQGFVMAPRIDNLSMAYASIQAIIESDSDRGINMAVCFDNEEVGSMSKQGAMSGLLESVMERIFTAYDKTTSQYKRVLPNSFVISADGSYSVHPNREDKSDPTNRCIINEGLTVKHGANRNYSTDTETAAILKQLAGEIDIKVQDYANNSDLRSGRTIGSIVESNIGVLGVDIGPAMLAMHASMEYMGTDDFYDCYRLFKHFYSK